MRQRPLSQDYSRYTAEDFRVWETLFNRQSPLLQRYAGHRYLESLRELQFHAGAIPDFRELNPVLLARTGWQLTVVPGHVPPVEFFRHLAARRFPATCWLRSVAELEYIEEPDMFHDVFGHVPLLIDPQYAAFMQRFGALAMDVIEDPDAIELLSRLYWFTIEFGLIQEGGSSKIYGAGILSSLGETRHSMSAVPERAPFEIDRVLDTGFRTDIIQDLYFAIETFDDLKSALEATSRVLSRRQQAVPES